jgi:hypothetical protein
MACFQSLVKLWSSGRRRQTFEALHERLELVELNWRTSSAYTARSRHWGMFSRWVISYDTE